MLHKYVDNLIIRDILVTIKFIVMYELGGFMSINNKKIRKASVIAAVTLAMGTMSVNASVADDNSKGKILSDCALTAGVSKDLSNVSGESFKLTAGVTSALSYTYNDVSIMTQSKDVVSAPESSQTGADAASDTTQQDQADENTQQSEAVQTAAQQCGYTNLAMSNISEGNLNIREEATTDSSVVGIMTKHNACEILEDDGEWLKIKSGKVTGYVNASYIATGDEAEAMAQEEMSTVATVKTETLRVRSDKSTDSSIVSLVGDSEKLTVNSVDGQWVEVTVDDETGYVASDFVELSKSLPTAKTITEVKYGDGVSDVRVGLVQYALSFVGNRYVWGGTSLTNGVDCSGFTMQILGKYGVSLPHSSSAQPGCGTIINSSDAQPGDLFFYGSGSSISHVAIYIGDGQIVHASNSRDGIKVSNAYYRTPICVARYF